MLEVEDLVAGYTTPVVGPLSFRIATGDVVGLWGVNGAGKSTALKAITGQARVFGGRIRRAHNLSLACQGQHPDRLPLMPFRAREYLDYLGATHHRSHIPGRLEGLLQQRLDRLSGGQFQLLTVWSRLAGEADLVCLDEPTNNLDPEGIIALRELLSAGPAWGRGVLVVSHERDFMEQVCSRIVEVQPWSG